MAVEAACIIPIFFFRETKRLDLRRNQAFHNASGGDKRDRTADLLNAIQALSQLSYAPKSFTSDIIRKKGYFVNSFLTKSKASFCDTAFHTLFRQCFSIPHPQNADPMS